MFCHPGTHIAEQGEPGSQSERNIPLPMGAAAIWTHPEGSHKSSPAPKGTVTVSQDQGMFAKSVIPHLRLVRGPERHDSRQRLPASALPCAGLP